MTPEERISPVLTVTETTTADDGTTTVTFGDGAVVDIGPDGMPRWRKATR